MSDAIISLRGISKHFGGVRSLNDVSLDIQPGEVIGLAGENGSGKSTFIKVLAGVHAQTAGQIFINGQATTAYSPTTAVKAGIQIIFQDFSLFPSISVAENIALPGQLTAGRLIVDRASGKAIAEDALNRLGVSIDLDERPENLSVADKQLVAIARALTNNAKLVVMDEPTTALTEKEISNLLSIVKKLRDEGVAVIFVSHKLQEMFEICTRFVVLRNGELVASGPAADFDTRSLSSYITGRDVPQGHHQVPADGFGAEILRLEGLSRGKHFTDVSLAIHEREIVGLAGVLGSGRTELAKALFGLAKVDSGAIFLNGATVSIGSPQQAIDQGIAYVPEDRLTEGLFLDRSIEDNVAAGLIDRFISSVGVVRRDSLRTTIHHWLSRLKVKGKPAAPVQSLSGGNQQRVVLARALGQAPKLMVLNGPSVGVDIGSKADIHNVIHEFAGMGMGTLLISDDLSELLACCDRILIMKNGRICQNITNNNLDENMLARSIAQ